MKYNHIAVEGIHNEGQEPIDDTIRMAVTNMRSQDFDTSRETLRSLLSTVREQKWVNKESQRLFATEDGMQRSYGRHISDPPTPLLLQLLIKHPDLIPFVIDHYLISGGGKTDSLMITEESRDNFEKIKAKKMERLLSDLNYSPNELTDAEKQIALAHQYDALKSELLEAFFIYPRQTISFDQSKKTRENLGNIMNEKI